MSQMADADGILLMLALVALYGGRVLVSGVGGRHRAARIGVLDTVLLPLSWLALVVLAARFIGTIDPG